jgi:hypothetical protein
MSEFVEQVLALVSGARTGADPFAQPAFRSLLRHAQQAGTAEQDDLVRALLPGLEVDDPYHAACVALSCGTVVEYGASPIIAGAAIVARLFRELDEVEFSPPAVQYFCLAAMAHLCRDRGVRQQARRRHGVPASLECAEPRVPHTWFVRTVLELADDLELLVLAPEQRRGFVVRADAVRSCFHLFTLLQGALIGDSEQGWLRAEPEDPDVLALATGQVPHVEIVAARQRFHFHDGSALCADGTLRQDLGSTIWGEASPADIPRYGDRPIVLIGPPVLGGRSWNSNFFANIHDALRSNVTVLSHLTPDELTQTLAALPTRTAAATSAT